MKTVTTRPYAVVLAAAAIVIVAGCTGDPTPPPAGAATPPASSTSTSPTPTSSATPTTPASTTPSTSSSPTADPNVPAAAKAQTSDGAKALTSYFFGLVNQAWTRPQMGLLSPLFTPACSSCQNFEDNASKYVREKTRYDKTPLEVLEVSTHGPAVTGPKQTIDVVVHQVAANVVDASGKTVSNVKEQQGIFVTDLAWTNGGWKLTSIKVLQ